jgi:hypothetical protein
LSIGSDRPPSWSHSGLPVLPFRHNFILEAAPVPATPAAGQTIADGAGEGVAASFERVQNLQQFFRNEDQTSRQSIQGIARAWNEVTVVQQDEWQQDEKIAIDRVGEEGQRFLLVLEESRPRRLPFGVRVGIFVLGWLLVLIGVAGLVLPGIQGVFTILAGAALLSVDNELIYRLMHRCLKRWPAVWQRVEAFRDKLHTKLHRFRRH